MFLASVHDGRIDYRPITMEKPYAKVGETGVQYLGPPTSDQAASSLAIGVFGPHAAEAIRTAEVSRFLEQSNFITKRYSLVAIDSQASWERLPVIW